MFTALFDIYKIQHGGGSQQQTPRQQLFTGGTLSSSSGHRQSRKDLMTNLMNEVQNESSKKSRFDTDLDELNIYVHTKFSWTETVENFKDLNFIKILARK